MVTGAFFHRAAVLVLMNCVGRVMSAATQMRVVSLNTSSISASIASLR